MKKFLRRSLFTVVVLSVPGTLAGILLFLAAQRIPLINGFPMTAPWWWLSTDILNLQFSALPELSKKLIEFTFFAVPVFDGIAIYIIQDLLKDQKDSQPALSNSERYFPFTIYSTNQLEDLKKSLLERYAGIEHQPRYPDARQRGLESTLDTNFLIVKGRSGLGKTKECIELFRRLAEDKMEEFVILRPKPDFDRPAARDIPSDFAPRNIILFIDDVQTWCTSQTGNRADGPPQRTFHDRLASTIAWMEDRFPGKDWRVVVTAGDEPEHQERIQLDAAVWSNFTRYQLPGIHYEARPAFIRAIGKHYSLNVEDEAVNYIKIESDGTCAGIINVLAGESSRRSGKPGTIKLSDILKYTFHYPADWEHEVYERSIKPHSARRSVFEALSLLYELGIPAHISMVIDLAAHLSEQGRFRKLKLKWQWLTKSRMTKTIRHELIAWIFEYRGELICPSAYIEGRVEVAKLLPDVILTLKNALRQRDPPEDLLPALVGLKFRLSVNRDVAKELLGLLEAWKGGEDYAPLSMAKSTLLAQLGRYDESLNAAVTALDADPRSVAALLTLSYAQSRSGLYIQAEKTARQATDVAPYDDYAWLALGIVLARQGDHDGSALALERACMINPRSARAWCSLGVTYDLQGRLNESIDACEHSIELDPRNVDAWHILGIAYDRDGRTEEAVKALREAKRLSNSDGAVSLSLSRALYSAGQTEESLTALKNAEALLKAAADVERLSAVSIAYRKNGYPKQAGELASHVLTIAPNHFDAQLTLAISLGQLAAYKKEAQEARIRLGQLCRSADDWYELSVAYGTAGYFEDAVTAAQCALKIDPRHQAAWRNLILDFAHLPGHEKDSLQARLRLRELCRTAEDWCELSVACGRIRQHKEAIDAAQKALDIDPHHVPSLQSLARNLGALGQHNETLPIISRIEELDAEHATADRTKLKRKKQAVKANPLSPILWTHMAQTYRYAGRSTEAIAIAREIVQESPEAAPHCIGLAKDLLAFEPEAVASLITYLLTFDPTNTNYLHLRGVAKEKSGKAGEAIEDHKLACERDPDQEGYWYALGKAFEALHRRAEAMNAYKRAVTINQHYEKAQKAFDRLASHAERGDS